MNATVLYLPLATTAGLALIFHALPRITRNDIYFAVTVPAAFRSRPEARRILLAYRAQVWLHAVVAAALILLSSSLGRSELTGIGMIWQFAGFTVAFLIGRRAVQPYGVPADSHREAEIVPRSGGLPGGWIGQLAPFLVLLLVGLVIYGNWDGLPERWPVHWGVDGRPDRWVERTPFSVLGSLAMLGAACAFILLVALGIQRRSRRIAVTGTSAVSERVFQRAVLWLMLGTEYFMVLYIGALGLWPIWSESDGNGSIGWLPVVALPGFLLAILLIFVRIGQGGSRLQPIPERDQPIGDRTSDDCWKLGLFYINRDDPAVFVEKRFGIGYTVNFGNYRVWIGLAVILALPIVMGIVRDGGG